MSSYLEIKENWKKIRGFFKNPLVFLGVIPLILFILFAFTPFFKILPTKAKPSFLSNLSQTFSQSSSKNLFLNSANQFLIEGPDFLLVEKTSLRASTPPSLVSPQVLGTLVAGYEIEDTKKIITEYVVEPEDSLWQIAEKFNISLETVLWANNLSKNSVIRPGQKLVIPPVSGVIHHVKAGDTVSEIAKKYKGKVEEIVTFNELSSERDIYVGDIIIVPNGVMPVPVKKPAKKLISQSTPLASSYFICPVAGGCRITQGLHWYNAVDFSNGRCGEPVLAAAGGTIQKTGYDRIAGNYVRILHPNGLVTFYGHLSRITVKSGIPVNVGEIIGYIGNTGYTVGPTGCHLHFEVRGGRNPFAK